MSDHRAPWLHPQKPAPDSPQGTPPDNKKGFPGGSVVQNPPARAGDRSSIPDLGGSHPRWGNKARAPQLLSLTEPESPGTEAPELTRCGACAQREGSQAVRGPHTTPEKSLRGTETQHREERDLKIVCKKARKAAEDSGKPLCPSKSGLSLHEVETVALRAMVTTIV